MKRHLPLFLFTTVTLIAVYSQPGPVTPEELGSDLGIQVFNQIVKSKPQENVIVSPRGIASLLGMLQFGADGKTKKQLTTVMRYRMHDVSKILKKNNKAIMSRKNKDIVTTANAVFAKSGFKLEMPFITRNRDVFHSEVRSLDFENRTAASSTINQWVKNETKGMIENLVTPDIIDSALTRLMLVNAMYFKGQWKSRFQPENTKKRNFNGPDGKVYQVPMLSQLSVFRSGFTSTPNGLWYNVIELPYHGGSLSMLVAIPIEESTPLSAIIPHISTKTLQSWMTMTQKRVQVILPKFSAEAETDLKEPLKNLGITDMFDQSKANFAKITRAEHLHVSHMLQKAKIEVSEDGTKASSATTAILIARSSPSWFIADRPFLFFIRHNPTGAVLFMGQINKP
ncbi:glia-derived nexin [Rhinatrema bivittatum]|uniref:glia-derived nexin n=1 Tax=Rhinatrema bivittatum TaxID=194408 RepID=UPI001128B485|nr:glia-derived nexin [Rhinatrema bivittatum]XP_029471680.1 glia-derived nexin [Rhinatrema bivittatum]XP_029471681.1 glia-derived nexin [Rhinatrema bivittatum]